MQPVRARFRRRVSIRHQHGALLIRIKRHNDRTTQIILVVGFTAGFAYFCSVLMPPFFRFGFSKEVLILLPFVGFLILWYLIGLRFSVWRAFGTEEISVNGGILHWTRTALCWKRDFETATADVTEVRAVTPWHSLSNRVEFTSRGRQHAVGDMLLRDEANELAHELRQALALRG
jgi:uncharacterized membrane protein